MNRRHFLFAGTSLTLLAACADDTSAPTAALPPLRHLVTLPTDSEPQRGDLSKFPNCTYCGMDRGHSHQSRHLIHFEDNTVDPTCSIRCTAISLSVNLDRAPKAIYVADFGAEASPKPLIRAEAATYLVGSSLPATMSTHSKLAFADLEEAMVARSRHNGRLAAFDGALAAAYVDMAGDSRAVRQQRAALRAKPADSK